VCGKRTGMLPHAVPFAGERSRDRLVLCPLYLLTKCNFKCSAVTKRQGDNGCWAESQESRLDMCRYQFTRLGIRCRLRLGQPKSFHRVASTRPVAPRQ
jgi:hypothetical protein